MFGLQNLGFRMVFGGPGGFRKIREADRMNFLQLSSKSDLMISSHDQKANSFYDSKNNDYSNLSVFAISDFLEEFPF